MHHLFSKDKTDPTYANCYTSSGTPECSTLWDSQKAHSSKTWSKEDLKSTDHHGMNNKASTYANRHAIAPQACKANTGKNTKINQKQWWHGAHRVLSNHKVDSTYVNCYTFNCQTWNAKPPPAPNHPYPCEEENRVFRLLGTNFGL